MALELNNDSIKDLKSSQSVLNQTFPSQPPPCHTKYPSPNKSPEDVSERPKPEEAENATGPKQQLAQSRKNIIAGLIILANFVTVSPPAIPD